MVVQGQLHIYGINEGEDVVLNPGELVHINQSYFYQLCNETDEMCVLYGVFTKPPKPAKKEPLQLSRPEGHRRSGDARRRIVIPARFARAPSSGAPIVEEEDPRGDHRR